MQTVRKFMKFQLPRVVKNFVLLGFCFLVLFQTSCKKEVTEVTIDAFAQLNNEVKYNQGTYNILFTLQEYSYKEVGVRIGTNKALFTSQTNTITFIANPVSQNRYGIFVNNLTPNKIYYYQIFVKDSASSKEVSSDIFSFNTNP